MAILEISGVLRNSGRWYIDVSWFFKKRLDILYRMCNVKLDKHSIALELLKHTGIDNYTIVAEFCMHISKDTDWHELKRMCDMFDICYWRLPSNDRVLCNIRWKPEEFGIDNTTCNDMYFQAKRQWLYKHQ